MHFKVVGKRAGGAAKKEGGRRGAGGLGQREVQGAKWAGGAERRGLLMPHYATYYIYLYSADFTQQIYVLGPTQPPIARF